MSLSRTGFWAAGFWNPNFWRDGFWYEVPAPQGAFSGGPPPKRRQLFSSAVSISGGGEVRVQAAKTHEESPIEEQQFVLLAMQ